MDPDRRHVQLTPEVAEEQERMDAYGMRANYYLTRLREWGVPDLLAFDLVRDWHANELECE